jgi:hypothetical protein
VGDGELDLEPLIRERLARADRSVVFLERA